jgi:hypothetical protein
VFLTHDDVVTGKAIVIEFLHGFYDIRLYGIEMDIPDEFHEVGVFFTDNRGIAVLEKMP